MPRKKTVETVTVHPHEQALREKYCTHMLVPGSLRVSGGREGWGKKWTVEVTCRAKGCRATRVVASSDLQFARTAFCAACAAEAKKAARKAARTGTKTAAKKGA